MTIYIEGKFHSTIKLYENGKINNPEGIPTWELSGNTIKMYWPDAKAPSGCWVDTANLSGDGHSYFGYNQNNIASMAS